MKCSECNENIYHLFDNNNDALAAALKEHIAGCADCYAEYESMMDVITVLKPRQAIKAPLVIKENVLKQVNTPGKKKSLAKTVALNAPWKKLAVAAAIITTILIAPLLFRKNSNEAQAENLLSIAINAGKGVRNFVMHVSVRTGAAESFDYISMDSPLISHTILRSFDNKDAWSIRKTGREVIFNGNDQYMHIPSMKVVYKGDENAGFVSWMRLLLDPESILWKEKENAEANGSNVKISVIHEDTILSITTKSTGNFMDDQLRNENLYTANSRREYTFDHKTHLLKGLKIYSVSGRKEILILSIDQVMYNSMFDPQAFQFNIPAGVEVKNVNNTYPASKETDGISSKLAARMALQDLSKGDFNTHAHLWNEYSSFTLGLLHKNYADFTIVRIGEPFQSSAVYGEVVPYEIQFPGGYIKKFRLIVYKSKSTGHWVVKGGL